MEDSKKELTTMRKMINPMCDRSDACTATTKQHCSIEIETLQKDRKECIALLSFFTIWLKEPIVGDEWVEQYNQLKDLGFPLPSNNVTKQFFEIQIKRHISSTFSKVPMFSECIPRIRVMWPVRGQGGNIRMARTMAVFVSYKRRATHDCFKCEGCKGNRHW